MLNSRLLLIQGVLKQHLCQQQFKICCNSYLNLPQFIILLLSLGREAFVHAYDLYIQSLAKNAKKTNNYNEETENVLIVNKNVPEIVCNGHTQYCKYSRFRHPV